MTSIRSLFYLTAFSLGFGSLQAQTTKTGENPVITASEIAQYRAAHEAEWMKSIATTQSRLFYTEKEWPETIARIAALQGKGAEWRKALFISADFIVSDPLPVYIEPKVVNGKTAPDSQEWQREPADQIVNLALAAKLSPDPKYRARLHDLVMTACAFNSWGTANNDLAAGHMSRAVAIAYDWHRSLFTPQEQELIRTTVRTRVAFLLKALLGNKYWCREYTWNHNHISVMGMGFSGLAFLGEIPEAADWLSAALLDYENIAKYSATDGSSNEGVGYWTYGRAFILEFIEGTKKITDSGKLYDEPFLRQAIAFRIGSATPDLDGVSRWGDSTGRDFNGSHHILYRLASQYRDGQGQYVANHLPYSPYVGPRNVSYAWTLLWYDPSLPETVPHELDYHATGLDAVTSRSGWDNGDYVIGLKSGVNSDAHTHLDAGAINFYMGKNWMLTAPGYGHGKDSPGFWDRDVNRWTFFSNATESETTLLINGKNQRSDKAARGTIDHFISSAQSLWTEVNLDQAYNDTRSVRRRLLHRRGDYLLVLDEVAADKPVTVDWLAQADPKAILSKDGALLFSSFAGTAQLQMLGQAAPFAKRKPTSPQVDVDRLTLKTYSSTSQGTDVKLAALLQPTFIGQTAVPLRTKVENRGDVLAVTIDGPDWSDLIFTRTTSGPVGARVGEEKDRAFPMVDGYALAIRYKAKELASCIAVGATNFATAPLTFSTSQPVDLTLEFAPQNAYVLDLATPFSGTIQLGAGLTCFDDKGKAVSLGKNQNTLSAGRYFLTTTAESIPALRRWIASHLTPRRLSATAATPNELVRNPGFEFGEAGWKPLHIPNESKDKGCSFVVSYSEKNRRTGQASALLESAETARYGFTPGGMPAVVRPGERYLISVWVRPNENFQVSPGTPGALLRVYVEKQQDRSRQEVRTFTIGIKGIATSDKPIAELAETALPKEWIELKAEIEIPTDADRLTTSLFVWSAKGKLHVDDFTVTRVSK